MILRGWAAVVVVTWTLSALARNHAPMLPLVAEIDTCYTFEQVCARMKHQALHPVEGVWQLTADGACIAIERDCSAQPRSAIEGVTYRMVLIESPYRAARSGSVIGVIRPSAKPNVYNARIYTSMTGNKLCNPRGFMMQVEEKSTDSGMIDHLVLIQDKPGLQINVWNLIPYLYRRVVRRNAPRPDVDGCVRIFPEPVKPRFPRYL